MLVNRIDDRIVNFHIDDVKPSSSANLIDIDVVFNIDYVEARNQINKIDLLLNKEIDSTIGDILRLQHTVSNSDKENELFFKVNMMIITNRVLVEMGIC